MRLAALLGALSLLAACAMPPSPASIRPGFGTELALDTLRPPSGVTYKYVLKNDAVPIPVSMELTSRRLSAKNYRYGGRLIMTLPEAQNLEEIEKIISRALGQSSVRARGNQLFIPVEIRSDNRFRSTSSSITGDRTRYTPHDCFGVVGTCRYTATDRGGAAASLVTTTVVEDGVWRSTTVLDPKAKNTGLVDETRRAVYSIDKNGVLIDMVVTRGTGAKRSSFSIKRK